VQVPDAVPHVEPFLACSRLVLGHGVDTEVTAPEFLHIDAPPDVIVSETGRRMDAWWEMIGYTLHDIDIDFGYEDADDSA
jgi:hypothetical protein